jgi:hypothetical protein
MDLEKEILKEHSKNQTLKIVRYIGDDPDRFSSLIHLFLNGSDVVTQRASWIVSYCVDAHPALIQPHLNAVIKNLQKPVHHAVKRHTLRVLENIEIPKKFYGILADLCFKFLTSSTEPVAVKAFSMTVLYHITEKEPDLKNELKVIIEDQMPYSSPAFLSRGKKILASLNKKVLR